MRNLNEYSLHTAWESFLSYRERKLRGVPTGIECIDRAVLGLGGITIIQGAPGAMKSSLALQIAHHNAAMGHPALIIDRENGRERFRMRLLCQANTISATQVMTCSENELRGYVQNVMELPIYACTDPVENFEEIQATIAEMWRVHERPMLLVVDSLQSLPIIAEDERLSIQKWLGYFDQAKLDWEGKLTTIITSEKKRGDNEYGKASLSAGKGSGNIEYKAELVLDLRRDEQSGNIIAEVVKNRDGSSNISFVLEPWLANLSNKASFCFKLRAAESIDI